VGLTYGTGPFGDQPAGRFNVPAPREDVLYLEDSPRWIRGRFADEVVVDSRRVKLLHESLRLPVFYFPEGDVRTDLLRPSGRSEEQPPKGTAVFLSLAVGDRRADDAAWTFTAGAGSLAGLIGVRFDALDDWLEEDEPLYGHPRDPYHRIDVRRTSRHVRVRAGVEVLAETRRARVLFETGLPPRWYIPQEDVRVDLLEPSETRTVCAYKGFASYWHVRGEDDLVWTYRDPFTDALEVKDLLAFFNERVDIEVDGEAQARPRTQWSRD
jgi:uncharacterized protein (DUF427 family)